MKKIKRFITENDLLSDEQADTRVVIFIAATLTILVMLGILGIQ